MVVSPRHSNRAIYMALKVEEGPRKQWHSPPELSLSNRSHSSSPGAPFLKTADLLLPYPNPQYLAHQEIRQEVAKSSLNRGVFPYHRLTDGHMVCGHTPRLQAPWEF